MSRRKSKFGVRPGDTTQELYSKREIDEEGSEIEVDSKWCKVRGIMTRTDKRKLLKKVLELGIMTLMRNHIYQFEGKSRVQREGGSIGIAVTGVIARIRMMRWSRLFKEKCKSNNLDLEL